ncbi:unnamed protein product [Prorocentrum cordatum]|uniref:fructose-bisphosphate aldolase n=1 Tax=Prorocentrum cordatum TaxID=2364126 RepID=A0ABN9WVH8_9DINO|nr:unnamed protein product [Polarella glacialis]
MTPGIKVDNAYNKKGMWGIDVGPLGHPEVSTVGLDGLQKRCAEAYAKGARFAKWCSVLQLDPETGLPSDLAIADTVRTLARYASICQREKLVPIVGPEIVPHGKARHRRLCEGDREDAGRPVQGSRGSPISTWRAAS